MDRALNEVKANEIMRRIWAHDYTVRAADPQEITNRLGWLDSPENMLATIERIQHLVDDVRDAGYTHILLLGMGGSSLAPEVFSNVFSQDHHGLELTVLDSTDPDAVKSLGYGPRFLHSTGQLHKGDAGNGLFIQFLSLSDSDIPIPDEAGEDSSSISFGVLKAAQALGDAQALREANRRVIQFQMNGDTTVALQAFVDNLN